jgi:hypothetical protein
VSYHEIALVAAAAWTPVDSLSIAPRVRVPVWVDEGELPYTFAGGIEVTWVSARREPEEVHFDGDGHSH